MSKVSISEFIISIVELVDAQMDDMRISFHKSAEGVGLLLLCVLVQLVAFVFALIGVRLLLSLFVGEIVSYFIAAVLSLLIALFIAKVASWKSKKKQN